MRSFLSRTIWPWTATIAALALLAGAALAHDDRHVGEYKLNVGFNVEPAYEGVPNGIDIRVTRSAEGGNGDGHDSDREGGNGDGHDSDGEGGNGDGHDSDRGRRQRRRPRQRRGRRQRRRPHRRRGRR